MLVVLGENSCCSGYSRNLPFSKWIEKSRWTLNQKCSSSSPSLFSQVFAAEKRNVVSGSLSSCKNFAWETLVLVHNLLSQLRVCFSCSWWLFFFSSSVFANETSLQYGGRLMFAKQVDVRGCVFHCPTMKVQEHGEPKVINLLFSTKVINSACSSGYWLVIFSSLIKAHSLCENWELKSEWQFPGH